MLNNFRLAANHQAIATLETPYTAACAAIDIMQIVRLEFLRPVDIVVIVGITTVDHDIARSELRYQGVESRIDHRGRHHQPYRARLRQPLEQVIERLRADGTFTRHRAHGIRGHVVDHAFMAALEQASHHIGAHPSEPNHSKLHRFLLAWWPRPKISGTPLALGEFPTGFGRCAHC
jgi:hypothetical protein